MATKETKQISEKRRFKRIPAPVGTTALFKNIDGSLEKLHVRDISVIGMLVCGYNSAKRYPINSTINDILIDIPPDELNAGSRISLLIDNCKIVRSFFEQDSKILCHGIELTYKSSYLKEKIESLVNKA